MQAKTRWRQAGSASSSLGLDGLRLRELAARCPLFGTVSLTYVMRAREKTERALAGFL